MNFNQYFESDADYIIFARSLYEQHNLRSSVNFAIHNIKPGTLTAGTVKINFKGIVAMFVARHNAFLLTRPVKRTPAYWKQFLYDVQAIVTQLGIPTYFLTLPCTGIKWEELPYTINKILLNNNPALVARYF